MRRKRGALLTSMEEIVETSDKKRNQRFIGLRRAVFDINGIVLIVAVAGLMIVFSFLSPNFFTATNIRVVIETMSILAVLAMGEHFLLIAGEIDVSFTAMLELSAVVAALSSSGNTLIIIILAILSALSVGVINGLFTTRVGIPSFLVTLATMVGIQGVVFLISNYRTVLLRNDTVVQIFYGRWMAGMSASVLWMLIAIIGSGFLLQSTRFGRWTYATGGNERAARLMGIPTQRVKFLVFIIMSFTASVAGLIAAGRSIAARPKMGEAYLMPVIAAPVLGGALLTGGRGSVIRTVLGCLVLTIIINGVNLLGLEPAYQNIFMGGILVGTLSIRNLQKEGQSIFLDRFKKPKQK
jgi:ribose transport system permease protein